MKRFSAFRAWRVLGLFAVLALLDAARGRAASLLLISVDGMKPEYVLEAGSHGLKIPFLRTMLATGSFAQGVVGVWPTITYPSHTTLVTGVSPGEHGILANLEFDPLHHFDESWFWYAEQIRAPTLWQAAHAAGLATASVGWPVTVGASDIDFLIPEFWRAFGPTENLNPSDRHLIAALSRPAGLLEQMRATAGEYMMGNDLSIGGDAIKTRFAAELLRTRKPGFMTVHLSSLDEAEHDHGPFSPEADQALEAIDADLAQLAAAERDGDPESIVAVVSDHGFAPLTHRVNLFVPFLKAGLIETAADSGAKSPQITSWRAEPWLAGGMAAIMLRDPGDAQTQREVGELLRKLAANPDNGIASIRDRAEIKTLGGFPQAAYLVVLKPGYYAGANTSGEFVTPSPANRGGHGFSPEYPDMRAAFFIAGPGIARHRDLGVIDMLQIAPTLARLMGASLPSAKAPPLRVHN